MMDNIDEEFARIIGSVEQEVHERYIWREEGLLRIALPHAAREAVRHVAQLVAMHADEINAPDVYDDPSEQLTYQLLHTDSIRSALGEACRAVESSAFDDTAQSSTLHAWIQVLNHAKFLAVENLEPATTSQTERDERQAFIHFLNAVQHEVLQALL
jgi:hypothetical protein